MPEVSKQFLEEVKSYIEEQDRKGENEWGEGRALDALIEKNLMPEIYEEVVKMLCLISPNKELQSRQEFEKAYCETHPRAVFGETHISLECNCEDGGHTEHWAAVRNDPASIESHFAHEDLIKSIRNYEPSSCVNPFEYP